MNPRESTRSVAIGGLQLGGNNHILVQSMCNIKTSRYEEVSAQINRCADLGAELMRVSVLDFEDAAAIKEIKKRIRIPLVADIHMDYRLALASLDSGVDAVRINPGNIGDIVKIKAVVEACKAHHAPIRIGVNSGSLDKSIYYGKDIIKGEYLLESAAKHVKILEEMDFHDIVLSLKGSSVQETLEAYRLAASVSPTRFILVLPKLARKILALFAARPAFLRFFWMA